MIPPPTRDLAPLQPFSGGCTALIKRKSENYKSLQTRMDSTNINRINIVRFAVSAPPNSNDNTAGESFDNQTAANAGN